MREIWVAGVMAGAIAMTGCGGSDEPEPEDEPMKVEDTAFGDLVGTQDKVRDRANQAVEMHREALDQRVEEDAGAPPGE
jgi:hypothetical protein